ncbi:DUF4129 domain-containing protein [Aestuariivivens sediminis]|uniref:DUF4129 domain-containing protein n=1 Tax=Aestuariivivens sediminis TaxID=2913557 RepID=UPI001F572025|nr:DUF4129 domain-containing protein [Aestuariivivens sediminis]
MNKNYGLHIIVFLMGFLWMSHVSEKSAIIPFEPQQNTRDSLQIDTGKVSPRKFEDFNDRYTDDDFIYERTVENSGWWMRFKQWLTDIFWDLFNLKNKEQAAEITNVAIKIAGIIIFLLVVYFIVKAILNEEGTWVFGKLSDKSIIPASTIETHIHTTDFKALIQDAENQNNYRLVIRYYYLWLLKSLSETGAIAYDLEKTNSDYFNEIASTEIKEGFAYTSYLYNYIWYGEFNIDDSQFGKAKQAFVKLLSLLKE